MTSVERTPTIDRVAEKLSIPIRRGRGSSNATPLPVAPSTNDPNYNKELASVAAKMLYRSGHDASGNPLLILSGAAFPDAREVDYTELLPYVLALLPGEDEMKILDQHVEAGKSGYSVVFFAGGGKGDKDAKSRPSWAWTVQAYHLLGRAVKKRIKKLWVVHEKAWVRIMLEMLSSVISSKFRKKIIHVDDLTHLAQLLDITRLNIQPAVYLYDKKISESIILPAFPPRPQFNYVPFPTTDSPLPQVLVDTSRYIRLHCLSTEGIFRIPPSSQLLEVAREAYDRRQFLLLSDYGPHIAAGLLKLYYRTLPEPVVPRACYKDMYEFGNLVDNDEKVSSAKELLDNILPKASRRLLLQHLIPLLALVASHADENKMTSQNLAICFAPSFVRSDDVMEDANVSKLGVCKLLEVLIDNVESFTNKIPDRQIKGPEDVKSPPTVKRSPAFKAKKSQPRDAGSIEEEATIRVVDNSPIEFAKPLNRPIKSSSLTNSTTSTADLTGMPSPPPSPSSEIPEIPIEPIQPTRTYSFNQISSPPPKVSSSPPKPTTSPKPSLSSKPSLPSMRSGSPTESQTDTRSGAVSSPREAPQIRSLMRVATTPAPAISAPAQKVTLRKTSTSQLRSTSPSPAPAIKARALSRVVSDSSALPRIGRVQTSGRAVDQLRALYEERAQSAEVLVRVGSVRAGSRSWK